MPKLKYKDGIAKLPNGKFHARVDKYEKVLDGKSLRPVKVRRIASGTFARAAEAKLFVQVHRHRSIFQALGCAPKLEEQVTLYDVMDRYLEWKKDAPITTYRDIVRSFRNLRAFFPDQRAVLLKTEALEEYWQERLKSGRTHGGVLVHELAYLKAAYRRSSVPRNWTIPETFRKRIPKPQRLVFRGHEIGALLEALPLESVERAFCELMARTGCRVGEARALRWDDINFERGVITIRATKTARIYTMPMSARLVEALQRWKSSCQRIPSTSGHVFTIQGRPLGQYSLRRRIRAGCKAAGLPEISIQTFRHSYIATLVYEAGLSPHIVQRMVGHSSVTTTEIYLSKSRPPEELAVNIDQFY